MINKKYKNIKCFFKNEEILDKYYNINTNKIYFTNKFSIDDYYNISYEAIFEILNNIDIEKYNELVDYYGNDGKFGLVSLSFGLKKVTLIENDIYAFKLMEKNKQTINPDDKNIEIININPTKYEVNKNSNLFFLNKPSIIKDYFKIIYKINQSIIEYPRNILIILYYNSAKKELSSILEKEKNITKIECFNTDNEHNIAEIWKN